MKSGFAKSVNDHGRHSWRDKMPVDTRQAGKGYGVNGESGIPLHRNDHCSCNQCSSHYGVAIAMFSIDRTFTRGLDRCFEVEWPAAGLARFIFRPRLGATLQAFQVYRLIYRLTIGVEYQCAVLAKIIEKLVEVTIRE